jgi:hypothetical protein
MILWSQVKLNRLTAELAWLRPNTCSVFDGHHLEAVVQLTEGIGEAGATLAILSPPDVRFR